MCFGYSNLIFRLIKAGILSFYSLILAQKIPDHFEYLKAPNSQICLVVISLLVVYKKKKSINSFYPYGLRVKMDCHHSIIILGFNFITFLKRMHHVRLGDTIKIFIDYF